MKKIFAVAVLVAMATIALAAPVLVGQAENKEVFPNLAVPSPPLPFAVTHPGMKVNPETVFPAMNVQPSAPKDKQPQKPIVIKPRRCRSGCSILYSDYSNERCA